MTLLPLFRQTFRSPREAAAMLLSMGVPKNGIWMAFILVMILSILVTEPLFALVPSETFGPPIQPMTRFLMTAPFSAAMVWVTWRLGRGFGGKASLSDAFLVFTYLEGVLTVGLAAMLVLVFVIPFLAGLFGLALTIGWVWLLGVFFAEAFSFSSPFKALGIVVLAWFIVYVAGLFLLSLVAGGGSV